jgi:hypothetical protein
MPHSAPPPASEASRRGARGPSVAASPGRSRSAATGCRRTGRDRRGDVRRPPGQIFHIICRPRRRFRRHYSRVMSVSPAGLARGPKSQAIRCGSAHVPPGRGLDRTGHARGFESGCSRGGAYGTPGDRRHEGVDFPRGPDPGQTIAPRRRPIAIRPSSSSPMSVRRGATMVRPSFNVRRHLHVRDVSEWQGDLESPVRAEPESRPTVLPTGPGILESRRVLDAAGNTLGTALNIGALTGNRSFSDFALLRHQRLLPASASGRRPASTSCSTACRPTPTCN